MDNLGAQEIDRIVSEMSKLSGGFKSYADEMSKAQAASKIERDLATKKFNKQLGGATDAVAALTGSYRSAVGYLATALGGSLFAKAINGVIHKGTELTKVYQDLATHGNTFGGSLLGMLDATARAGIPLDDFADATKKSSQVIAQMGRREWPTFQRQMRAAFVANGNFAMSMGQITDFSAAYLETYRRTGAAQTAGTTRLAKDMFDLAGLTSNLADATGKAKDEITNLANSALAASTAAATIKGLPASLQEAATKQVTTVTAILASQAGEAGNFLTSAFADTVGKGRAEFTAQGKTLIEAGMGGLVSQLNDLNAHKTVGETVKTINAFKEQLGANLPALQVLEASGNSSAAELRKVFENLQKMSQADIEKQAQRQDGITKFFNTIQTIWDQMTGNFQTGFLKGFLPFFNSVGDITKSKSMQKFGVLMTTFGQRMGDMVAKVLTPENVASIGSGLSSLAHGLLAVPWKSLFNGVVAGATVLSGIFSGIINVATGLKNIFGSWKPIILGVVGAFLALKALKLASLFKSVFGRTRSMVVNAVEVIVNGGGGGGGIGGELASGEAAAGEAAAKDGAKLSRWGKIKGGFGKAGKWAGRVGKSGLGMLGIMTATTAVEGAVTAGAAKAGEKAAAKGIGKGLTKSLLKKIPIIGAVMGLGFGIQRAMQGDWLGAGGELVSGLVSTIPGYGTAGSIGIDAALVARDIHNANSAPTDPAGGSVDTSTAAASAGATAVAPGANVEYGGTETDPTQPDPNDPMVETMKQLLTAMKDLARVQKENNDLLMGLAQSSHGDATEMTALLRKILVKP